jgi:uncharacterized protein with FMN-binding domain
MKKITLSLFVIAASGFYVWDQWAKGPADNLLGSALPSVDMALSASSPQRAAPVNVSLPTPDPFSSTTPVRVTPVATTEAANARYPDGSYTGPAIDAYYGLVQVQAIIQAGRLVEINVLQYPSDRRTSVSINRRALPTLHDEAISAQNANVDIVTGATLTSEAYIRSLSTALKQAGA